MTQALRAAPSEQSSVSSTGYPASHDPLDTSTLGFSPVDAVRRTCRARDQTAELVQGLDAPSRLLSRTCSDVVLLDGGTYVLYQLVAGRSRSSVQCLELTHIARRCCPSYEQ